MAQSGHTDCGNEGPLSGGGFNRSTQHPRTLSGTLERYANGRACTDVGHAEAKGKALRALEERPTGGRRRPTARETGAVSKILALNGGIAPAPRLECPSEQCCVDRLSSPGQSGH